MIIMSAKAPFINYDTGGGSAKIFLGTQIFFFGGGEFFLRLRRNHYIVMPLKTRFAFCLTLTKLV